MKPLNEKFVLSARLKEVRQDLYGENGIESLAAALGVTADTWRNYELGVTMPARVLLEFLVLTDVDPNWLLTGEGERFIPKLESFGSRPTRRARLFETR